MHTIYLDHNATTPMLREVAAAMEPWLTLKFGNPGSQHEFGRRARQALEQAREEIGSILGARLSGRKPDRVLLTSGGTEANNLALLGLTGGPFSSQSPAAIIVSAIEHPSVAGPAALLERRGWTVHRLGVTSAGVVDTRALDGTLNAQTRLVSVMLANNETGVLQPVAEIAQRCAELGVPMHTDAAQMVGKLPVDFATLGVAMMSIAAHKFHGPVGIGALVVRGDVEIEPLLFGGFQQDGLRPGTESVALAVGLHAALAAWQRDAASRAVQMAALRDQFEAGIARAFRGTTVVNGVAAPRLPHTANLALVGIDRQALLMALDQAGVACSTGSACASGSSEPSAVLKAMGCPSEVLAGSLRFSLGATTTAEEIEEAIVRVGRACAQLVTARSRQKTGQV